MHHDFPVISQNYLKAKDFQDNEMNLVYLGYEFKSNDNDLKPDKEGKTKSWKDKLDYILKYSYPEFQIDKRDGSQVLDEDGNPRRNSNFKPEFIHGYSIIYHLERNGSPTTLESGSYPLWKEFCQKGPKPGQAITIKRTGEKTETLWSLKIASPYSKTTSETPDENVPF